jgi:hypothetical protein
MRFLPSRNSVSEVLEFVAGRLLKAYGLLLQ